MSRFSEWVVQQRTSVRLGFLLQIGSRVLMALMSLFWTPLLLGAMGRQLYGTFISFQAVSSLGLLGDLGMGGAINLETSSALGTGRISELRIFLSNARALFLVLALAAATVFLVLAPVLPGWLHFQAAPGTGSLTRLFAVGSVGVALAVVGSYITNVNYACGNLTWSVVPVFCAIQIGILGHWILARMGFPLWVQMCSYYFSTLLVQAIWWSLLRRSHAGLAELLPMRMDRSILRPLVTRSFWVYFYSIGGTIYAATDRLLINAGFGPSAVPAYALNYRLCELASFAIAAASYASMPKITQWLASDATTVRERACDESLRLNRFQTLLGCLGALGYLGMNNLFVEKWLGSAYTVPLTLQAAFAANLAVTASGYVGFDLAARCGESGVRTGGLVVGVSAVVNLALSFLAMRMGSLVGIALATLAAQSVLTLSLGLYSARYLKMSWTRLSGRGWLISLGVVISGFVIQSTVAGRGSLGPLFALGLYGVVALAVAKALGFSVAEIRRELAVLRAMLGGRRG